MAHRIVGQPLGRLDGADKVSGVARYSADVTLPGLVWGKALRSPLPHARIVHIDTSKAPALPGVLTVLTAKDLLWHRLPGLSKRLSSEKGGSAR